MSVVTEVKVCGSCRHPFTDHIDAVGCTHATTVRGDDLLCVCDNYED